MFTETEQYTIKKFLSHRIDKLRLKTYKDIKGMSNREFDAICLEIRENVKMLREIEPQVTSSND